MVNIKDVRASNLTFKEAPFNNGLVAVFVGATSGIGMGTLKQFVKYANSPQVYILGRSERAAKGLLEELRTTNPNGNFDFIETEISLIKNVDIVCEKIKSKEKKVDLLFMTPGVLNLDSRKGVFQLLTFPRVFISIKQILSKVSTYHKPSGITPASASPISF